MSGDDESSAIEAVVGFVIMGVGLVGGGLVLYFGLKILAALVGAAMLLQTGSAPPIFLPFGGWVAHLFATIVEWTMIVIGLVMVWLLLTGRLNQTLDEPIVEGLGDGDSGRSNSNGNANPKPKSRSSTRSTGGSRATTGQSRTDDVEFDEYGQIRERR
jgi:hypothetical protein